jgi:hypothetical protein
MPRITLQGTNPDFSVDLEAALSVNARPNTQAFEWPKDFMVDIGYNGPSIGFDGFGIEFTATGMIYGNSSAQVTVEIGFVQSLTQSQALGFYRATPPRRFYRSHSGLPVKDGDPIDIWYKPDAVMKYLPQQMATLARLGPMQGLGFRVKVKDQVKSSFPTVFPDPNATLNISGFSLARSFVTCVAVRVTPTNGVSQLFFLDRVTWQCAYTGNRGTDGAWTPPPEANQFYTVGPVVPANPPFLAPPEIKLTGAVANQAETIRRM